MVLGRAGRHVELAADGETLRAYRAGPAAGHGPGVLVLAGESGLADAILDACERLAREGFVALAPDLLPDREGRDDGLDLEAAGIGLDGAVAALVGDPEVDGPRIGSLGFGLGGSLALLAAARSPRVGAAVDLDGGLGGLPLEGAKLEARVLALFGAGEPGAEEARRELERALAASDVAPVIRVVPGVAAGFMDDTRPERHEPRAAAESWGMVLSFLRAELS